VKPRRRFILKIFAYSVILFLFGRYLLHGYAAVLGIGTRLTNLFYRLPPDIEKFLYGSSMTMIAYLSLTLATPGMSASKKAGLAFGGIATFFLVDLLFVQYVIFPFRRAPLDETHLLYELYFGMKWALPFLLWITMCYPYIGEVFRTTQERKGIAR
jgi:hypothetical protein